MAATIFVIAMIIFIAAVWQVTRPNSKADITAIINDTAKLSLEEMADSMRRVDTTYTSLYKNYYGFALTQLPGGRAMDCSTNPCAGGGRLSTNISTYIPGLETTTTATRSFMVYKHSIVDDSYTPQTGSCTPD